MVDVRVERVSAVLGEIGQLRRAENERDELAADDADIDGMDSRRVAVADGCQERFSWPLR